MSDAIDRNLQLVAWAVLCVALAIFAALAVGVPSAALHYYRTATVEQAAGVSCKSGSCTLSRGESPAMVLRGGDPAREVSEGWAVGTDANARALLRFADGATANLEPDTTVVLERMRRARFGATDRASAVAIAVPAPSAGATARLKVGAAWDSGAYVVRTPHAVLRLAPESHARLELDEAALRVVGIEGTTTIENAGRVVTIGALERGEARAGSPPWPPMPALSNLVTNGDFDSLPQARGWLSRVDVPGGGTDAGRAFQTEVDGRTALRIQRAGSGGRPADIVFEQFLGDVDVMESTVISVGVRLRILAQSLPLGGMRGTELPAMVKLVGETVRGDQVTWTVGFFGVRPAADVPDGTFVLSHDIVNVETPLGAWTTFDSGNLLEADNPNGYDHLGVPAPDRLTRIEIIASGHDYASDIDAVEVWHR